MTRATRRAVVLALALAGCGAEGTEPGGPPQVSSPPPAARPPAVFDRVEEEEIEDARLRED